MAEFQFTKDINASRLLEEIKDSLLGAKLQEMRTKGDLLIIVTNSDLTPSEQSTLNSIVSVHTKINGTVAARDRARQNIFVGMEILAELSAYFGKRGLSSSELLLVNSRFSTFQQLLYSGFFELAKESLGQIQVDVLVPQAVLDQLNIKMQRFIDSVKNG